MRDDPSRTLLLAVARRMAHQYPELHEHINAVDPPEEPEPAEGEEPEAEVEEEDAPHPRRKRKSK